MLPRFKLLNAILKIYYWRQANPPFPIQKTKTKNKNKTKTKQKTKQIKIKPSLFYLYERVDPPSICILRISEGRPLINIHFISFVVKQQTAVTSTGIKSRNVNWYKKSYQLVTKQKH
jgi:hypothetical protein